MSGGDFFGIPDDKSMIAHSLQSQHIKMRPDVGQQQDLASLFECPVCFDYALPPIMQCQSGHIVCQSCRSKLSSCPTCRGPLGNIRNLAMEKVALTVMFPCRFSSNGCIVTLLHNDKTEHEETCDYRPYSCPCPGASCKWQGSLEQVMPHLVREHKSITTLQGEDIVFLATDINLPGAVDWVMMQSCFNHNFMLVLEKQDKFINGSQDVGHQQFYAIVQLIGTRRQAENFAYRLELNTVRRRLTWEATPRSIHDGVQSAIQESDCLVFDAATARRFSENGNLGINVTISCTGGGTSGMAGGNASGNATPTNNVSSGIVMGNTGGAASSNNNGNSVTIMSSTSSLISGNANSNIAVTSNVKHHSCVSQGTVNNGNNGNPHSNNNSCDPIINNHHSSGGMISQSSGNISGNASSSQHQQHNAPSCSGGTALSGTIVPGCHHHRRRFNNNSNNIPPTNCDVTMSNVVGGVQTCSSSLSAPCNGGVGCSHSGTVITSTGTNSVGTGSSTILGVSIGIGGNNAALGNNSNINGGSNVMTTLLSTTPHNASTNNMSHISGSGNNIMSQQQSNSNNLMGGGGGVGQSSSVGSSNNETGGGSVPMNTCNSSL